MRSDDYRAGLVRSGIYNIYYIVLKYIFETFFLKVYETTELGEISEIAQAMCHQHTRYCSMI
jgi:hypothetical protein